ncbi:hypothetical protein CYMTET_6211 [Cymbomonas tetramitiformis]|uniref:Uncharacterized protein n=1 Tax=Cymbomonas tetramitiformis TaxID=36881 RepID=A0AAE0GZH2_9CHLO|nr:hypothetical protein CYMTET_6211 [Cymbomonas tetramitiformis]
MREVFFGELLHWQGPRGTPHVGFSASGSGGSLQNGAGAHLARYLAHFDEAATHSMWIVYHDEGDSLYQRVFCTLPGPSPVVVPSEAWKRMRASPKELRHVMRHVLQALEALHTLGVTHRDVKLENLFVAREGAGGGSATGDATTPLSTGDGEDARQCLPVVRLGDFGSAVTVPLTRELRQMFPYGEPTVDDETGRCQPPEALDEEVQPQDHVRPPSYDMWGAGILWLELLLGTTDVWNRLVATARPVVLRRLRGSSAGRPSPHGERHAAVMLGLQLLGFMAPPPTATQSRRDVAMAQATPWEERSPDEAAEIGLCALKAADELGLGLQADVHALCLLRELLHPDPAQRISAEEALRHPYFAQEDPLLGTPGREGPELQLTPPGGSGGGLRLSAMPQLAEPGEVAPILCGVVQMQGLREQMEDRSVVARLLEGRFLLAACFDGHNGDAIAERLRLKLPGAVQSNLEEGMSPEWALRRALLDLDRYVKAKPIGGPQTGSTAVCVLIGTLPGETEECWRHRIWVASVGDSRAILGQRQDPRDWVPVPGSRVAWDGGEGTVAEVRSPAAGSTSGARLLVNVEEVGKEGGAAVRQKWLMAHKARNAYAQCVLATRITEDHKPDAEGELQRIAATATTHSTALESVLELPEGGGGTARVCGLAVSRSIGARAYTPFVIPDPDVSEVSQVAAGTAAGDVWALLLCSDGVWDVLTDQQAVEVVMSPNMTSPRGPDFARAETDHEMQRMAKAVAQEALNRGSRDNITCILLKIKWGECIPLLNYD